MISIETYKGSGNCVNAYEKKDIEALRRVFIEAQALWIGEWEAQGAKDYGTCTGGKGIQVWYRGPRKRSPEMVTVVHSPRVQGNLSASASNVSALAYLAAYGIEAFYYDGWMD
jgi:hypothetical protein